jgi:hypothetical protein
MSGNTSQALISYTEHTPSLVHEYALLRGMAIPSPLVLDVEERIDWKRREHASASWGIATQ